MTENDDNALVYGYQRGMATIQQLIHMTLTFRAQSHLQSHVCTVQYLLSPLQSSAIQALVSAAPDQLIHKTAEYTSTTTVQFGLECHDHAMLFQLQDALMSVTILPDLPQQSQTLHLFTA
uniref:ARAD1A15950p n=1 Tax=Blastobotrys adeninivorans TaxID=409370 RepID=A0A060SYG0_BLAAD